MMAMRVAILTPHPDMLSNDGHLDEHLDNHPDTPSNARHLDDNLDSHPDTLSNHCHLDDNLDTKLVRCVQKKRLVMFLCD